MDKDIEDQIQRLSTLAQEQISLLYQEKKICQDHVKFCDEKMDELLDYLQQIQEMSKYT